MDILLILNKIDMNCSILNKDLLEFTLSRLEPTHTIRIYTEEKVFSPKIKEKLVVASSKMEAIRDFAKGKTNFVVITRLALANINFDSLINYHLNHDKRVTVVSKNFVNNKSIPIYKLNDKKEVVAVTRKRFADCGIYLFKATVDFSKYKNIFAVILDMIDAKEVKGFVHRGYWWTAKNIRRKDNGRTINSK